MARQEGLWTALLAISALNVEHQERHPQLNSKILEHAWTTREDSLVRTNKNIPERRRGVPSYSDDLSPIQVGLVVQAPISLSPIASIHSIARSAPWRSAVLEPSST